MTASEPNFAGSAAANVTPPALRRTLGLWQVAFSGVGVILGAGVYALIGPTAGLAGNALWLAFLVAGTVAGLTAYTYARMGALHPKNSPEFQYTALAFGPAVGSAAGWQMLAADLLAAAAVALGFGGYLDHLVGVPPLAGSILLIGLIAGVTLLGVGQSIGLALALLLLDVLGLLFIVAIGLPYWPSVNYLEAPQGLSGVWGAASLIFFAYLGFDEIGNFAEEMRQPERHLPLALLLAMVMSTAVYLLVALSAVGAVGWRELSQSEAPLALVAGKALGSYADVDVSLVALAATGKTVVLLTSAARSVYGMAVAGALPGVLGRVSPKGTPVTATIAVLGVTLTLLFVGGLERVAGMANATILTSFLLTNLSLLWLAMRKRLGSSGGSRVADIVLPSLAVLSCGWLLIYTGLESITVAAVVGLGALTITSIYRHGRRNGPSEGAS